MDNEYYENYEEEDEHIALTLIKDMINVLRSGNYDDYDQDEFYNYLCMGLDDAELSSVAFNMPRSFYKNEDEKVNSIFIEMRQMVKTMQDEREENKRLFDI